MIVYDNENTVRASFNLNYKPQYFFHIYRKTKNR